MWPGESLRPTRRSHRGYRSARLGGSPPRCLASTFSSGVRGATKARGTAVPARETQFRRQADTLHFAGRAFWDFPDDEHLARDLEVGDAPDGELTNVFRRRHSVGPQHDGRRDVLAQRGMGDGKGYGLCHRRMFQKHFVDFPRGDFLPAAIDHLPYAAGEKQVPVVIEETEIPGLEPIACKRGLGRRRVAVVARHDARAPDNDLSGLAAGQQSPSFVHDRDVQIHRYADRTRLALARRQRIARDGRGSGLPSSRRTRSRRSRKSAPVPRRRGAVEEPTRSGRSAADSPPARSRLCRAWARIA